MLLILYPGNTMFIRVLVTDDDDVPTTGDTVTVTLVDPSGTVIVSNLLLDEVTGQTEYNYEKMIGPVSIAPGIKCQMTVNSVRGAFTNMASRGVYTRTYRGE